MTPTGSGRLLVIVAAMAAVTYALRLIPFLMPSAIWRKPRLRQLTTMLPAAVTAALVAPMILAPHGPLWLSLANPYLAAAGGTVVVALLTRNLALSVLAGMLLHTALL